MSKGCIYIDNLSERKIHILRLFVNGIKTESLEASIGNKNMIAFNDLLEEGYIEHEVLKNNGPIDFGPNVLPSSYFMDIEYGDYILTAKGVDALEEYDFAPQHPIHGNCESVRSSDYMIQKLQELIIEASLILAPTSKDKTYLERDRYSKWLASVKLFALQYLKEHPLNNDLDSLIFHSKSRISDVQDIKGYLQTILDSIPSSILNGNEAPLNMDSLIFISHCEEDKSYASALVTLLQRMRIDDKYIFSYSSPGHNIQLGKDIYEVLKEKLDYKQKVFVIYILSADFYRSPDCLNEMGAAWIASKDQVALLVPQFDFGQVKGVVGKGKIHMKIDDKNRLNDLKDRLVDFLGINAVSGNSWETMRDDFIISVSANLLPQLSLEQKNIYYGANASEKFEEIQQLLPKEYPLVWGPDEVVSWQADIEILEVYDVDYDEERMGAEWKNCVKGIRRVYKDGMKWLERGWRILKQ